MAIFEIQTSHPGVYQLRVRFPENYNHDTEKPGLLDIGKRAPGSDPNAVLVPLIPFAGLEQNVYFNATQADAICFYLQGLVPGMSFLLERIDPTAPELNSITNPGMVLRQDPKGAYQDIEVDILTTANQPTEHMFLVLSDESHLLCYDDSGWDMGGFYLTWFAKKELTGLEKNSFYELTVPDTLDIVSVSGTENNMIVTASDDPPAAVQFGTTSWATLFVPLSAENLIFEQDGQGLGAITVNEIDGLTLGVDSLLPTKNGLLQLPATVDNLVSFSFLMPAIVLSDGDNERLRYNRIHPSSGRNYMYLNRFNATFPEEGVFYFDYCGASVVPQFFVKVESEIQIIADECDAAKGYAVRREGTKNSILDFVIGGPVFTNVTVSFVAGSINHREPQHTPDNKTSLALILGISGGILFVILLGIGTYLA